MLIDNTMYSMYSKCGKMYFERYEVDNRDVQGQEDRTIVSAIQGTDGQSLPVKGDLLALELPGHESDSRGIELDQSSEGRDFGSRFHQLLHERRCRQLGYPLSLPALSGSAANSNGCAKELSPEWPVEDIEAECQSALAAYEAHYVRDYEYLESERTSVLDLPDRCPICWATGVRSLDLPDQSWCNTCNRAYGRHQLVVKLDAVVRHADGTIGPFDTKTENRPGYNTREDWAGKTQAKIYLWALGLLYPYEKVSRLIVDVVTRGSSKTRRQPTFYRHDDISSSPDSIDEAIRNVVRVADEIEQSRRLGWWKSNMNICKRGWERCDYYQLHVLGKTVENLRKYRKAQQYLEL